MQYIIYSAFLLGVVSRLAHSAAISGSCEEQLRYVLADFSPKQSENCYESEQALVEVMETCQAIDAVYVIALLRNAINKLDYAGCLGDTPHHDDECHEIFACFRPVFTTASSSFVCGPESSHVDTAVRCLDNKICHVAHNLREVLQQASVELCKGGACVNDAGVFRAVPGSRCEKYTWLVPETGRVYEYNVPPGTVFGVDICHHQFTSKTPCWI